MPQNQVTAHICPQCQGKGKIENASYLGLWKSWQSCPNCKSVGYIGRDANYEYYLEKDPKGKYRVAGVKKDRFLAEEAWQEQRKRFVLFLIIFLAIGGYAIFAGVHFLMLKNSMLFTVVTVFFIAILTVLILTRLNIFLWVRRKFLANIIEGPHDFVWEMEKRNS